MFVLQNATRPFTGIPSLRIEPMEVTTTRSPFDLSLFLRERAGKYIGHIEYSTDLFNRDRIERMAGHFRVLLEAVTSNPDQPITTLPILTEAERRQILIEWNDTAAEFPRDKCIHHLFENQVERTPEAIAVEFEEKKITYRELNQRANQLAHYLISLGIGPEKLVGVCIERSIEMVVGLLGILKAGGAYVPLDPAYPDERLRFMLEDSRVSILLTQEKLVQDSGLRTLDSDLRSSILDSGFQVVYLDRDFALIAQQKKKNPCSRVGSTNLAYVIYTSGSTGQPKGVAIEHRNTCNLIYWAKSIYAPEELKGVLASTSICFDLSVFELFAPISWGGTIILVENVLALSQAADTGITLVNTVPSGMAAVLSAGRLPDSIRVINLAGEPLQSELVEQLHRTGSVEKIYDLYGPSETTTYSTFNRRNPGGAVTIGRAISNTQIYLLDPNHMPVPIGVTGEIYIGGAGVARGYFNHPDLTGENFITDPFNCDSNNRLYRTGDLGRYLPDANVQFLGRIDNQVKIRGYRIELGEIESALNQHPYVKESIVIASSFTPSRRKRIKVEVTLSMDGMREETPLSLPSPIEGERVSDPDRNLIAYLVSNAEKPLVTGLRRFLNQKLPDHMVPSLFIFLDTLPLGPNGKIDRSKLPPPDEARSGLASAAIPPRSELEELVGNIWRDVLQFENVSIHDNFFSLGGHSLLAIQIVSRLQEAFNKEVPLRILFDNPTIAELGQELATIIREGHAPKLPPIVRAPRDEPLPLSVNQEHLWYLDRVIPGTHFLNMPFVYHLNGDLNVEALTRALKEIVRRHEVLRTRFGELDGNPVQIIGDGSDFELMAIDLRGESAEGVSQEAADLIVGERQVPFDLALGPLIRTKLLRLTENDYLLLLTIHHIISDYWSVQIIRRELFTLYEAYSQGRPSPLPEPAVQFADYAMWERRMLKDQFFQPDLRFWTRKLGGPSTEEFDTDKLRSKPFAPIAAEHIHIDETLWSNLKSLAREENCTPASVISTVLGIVVGHCTAREDVMIAMLVANRANPIIEHTIGHFVNTIILRTRISRTITPRQALRDIRRQMVQAIIHQQYPFEDLVRSLKSQKTDYGKSLFQVLLSYQSFSAVTAQFSGLTFAPFHTADAEPTPTRFDMVCRLRETSTTLTGTVNWRVDAFCPNIGPEVSALSVHLLKRIVSFPEKPVSEALAEARFR
jgi:amino acid adenylation domain-containing protein